jgi:hypothetical protein
MPGPRDEDDVDEENRDTDDRLEPQGDEAEPWQVGAKYCTSEGQDRSMDRVAQAASRIHARRVGSLAGGDFRHGRTWYPADAVRDGQRLADYGYVVLLPRTEVLIDR